MCWTAICRTDSLSSLRDLALHVGTNDASSSMKLFILSLRLFSTWLWVLLQHKQYRSFHMEWQLLTVFMWEAAVVTWHSYCSLAVHNSPCRNNKMLDLASEVDIRWYFLTFIQQQGSILIHISYKRKWKKWQTLGPKSMAKMLLQWFILCWQCVIVNTILPCTCLKDALLSSR